MLSETATTPKSPITNEPLKQRLQQLFPFLCLALVELVAFGCNAKNVGVYMDEWISFGQLHWLRDSLVQLISSFLHDPRKLVRPLESLNLPVLFYFVGEKPLWYHIWSYIFEFFSGWFLFLALKRFLRDPAVALAAAVLFLLYPSHDSSHYALVLLDLNIATCFFTLSLWLFLKGIENSRTSLLVYSGLAYFVSIFNHEDFLPLVAIYPLLAYCSLPQDKRPPKDLKSFISQHIPVGLVVASMIVFRLVILPKLKLGQDYGRCYDIGHMCTVIFAGVKSNISPETFYFCLRMIADLIKQGVPLASWLALAAVSGIVFAAVYIAGYATQDKQFAPPHTKNLALLLIGLTTLIFSYTIFGISREHMPTIETSLNRINVGGALGACLIIAALFGLLREFTTRTKSASATIQLSSIRFKAANLLLAFSMAIFTAALTMVDWQFAKPWIVSWQAQKGLIEVIREHKNEIRPGDCILIGGIVRFVKWAPVVDGVWDLQNIVRTTLDRKDVYATVVTERLSATPKALVDHYKNFVLCTFPYNQTILYSPEKSKWIRISSRQQFLEQAREMGWQNIDQGDVRAQ